MILQNLRDAKLKNLLSVMNGKNILVIGGTGFIGFNFIKKALTKEFIVTNISIKSTIQLKHKNLSHFNCDLLDQKNLSKILVNKTFHYVINFGNYIDHSDFLLGGDNILKTQVDGLTNILSNINRTDLIKFINIGSSDEYGGNNSPQNEKMNLKPFSPYSLGKTIVSEFLELLYASEQLPTLTLRPFLVYGPYQKLNRFLPHVISSCLKNKSFDCSAGTQIRDFCFVGDFIDAIFMALDKEEANGKTVNVASGIPVTIKEITLKIVDIIGKGNPKFGKIEMRNDENMSLYADISFAKNILNCQPKTDIDTGLSKTINFYKNI